MKDVFEEYGCVGGCLITLLALGILAGIYILLGWLFSLLWNFAMPHIWADAPMIDVLIGSSIVLMANMLLGCTINNK